ncbi:hypothetical protein Y1Q_0023045 [Alligator mississippiensis]|uniref:Uncharacterized protein n=1 Tax=Alligator mississippiensis TaxID=8496 RepID=A0A151P4Q0_ALLMI|nr:hypothetical protein Y1Q_0023045 [Alligator mississippiensis]
MAQEQETEFTPDKRKQVIWDKGVLYRLWVPKNHTETWEPHRQLIVPRGAPGVYWILVIRVDVWKGVQGPPDLVREEWEGKISSTKTSMVEYVLSFHQKLTDMMKVARDSLAQAQEKQSAWYDEKAHLRNFERGDKVMVFLPLKTDKLQAA